MAPAGLTPVAFVTASALSTPDWPITTRVRPGLTSPTPACAAAGTASISAIRSSRRPTQASTPARSRPCALEPDGADLHGGVHAVDVERGDAVALAGLEAQLAG